MGETEGEGQGEGEGGRARDREKVRGRGGKRASGRAGGAWHASRRIFSSNHAFAQLNLSSTPLPGTLLGGVTERELADATVRAGANLTLDVRLHQDASASSSASVYEQGFRTRRNPQNWLQISPVVEPATSRGA